MYYIGIDVGGMSIKAGVADINGNVLHKTTIVTRGNYDAEYTISNDIHKLIVKLLDEANIPEEKIAAVGIGQAGSIDSERGIINYWNNIPMKNVHVVEELKKWHKMPVFIDNDANVAALGECVFGAAKGLRNVMLVTLGTGVGSGIIIDGKIYRGEYGAGAEAGHMRIVMNGEPCTCGGRGCWEAYASVSALIRQTKAAMEKHPESMMCSIAAEMGEVNGITSFKAARAGDKAALEVVARYIEYVGTGLVSLQNIFRPQIFLIGGGISKEGEFLTDRLEKFVQNGMFDKETGDPVKIRPAALHNDAGILGAAALAIESVK
ncbi:MAG TPA: ROK family protein [Candidatus Caccalectryoclostridium excrementigallinarum]|uniref:Glucokinase n=1 Tax=Candidatus Caccalectryoclostridium excrementigallinarum TaxID=2840710 RepID=A0A9D1SKE1_9FIRM|nr:ROK family protein [Candidatus Caccalectryoclostridium excrementigallinarum]